MATSNKKKISDFFNQFSNPSGGVPSSMFPAPRANPYLSTLAANPNPLSGFFAGFSPRPRAPMMTPVPRGQATPAPVVPTPTPAAPVSAAPVAPVNPSRAPVGPQGATGAAPASQTPIPKQWLRADGSIKTPDEVAADIGLTLKNSSAQGDVGRLSLGQFGQDNRSAEELATEARRINNTRNDIAVGETDPYKVASKSGIAYTPAELAAIERAYAGIYDPALDSALSKVEAKRISDAEAQKRADDIAADERKFNYDVRLKQTPSGGTGGSSGFSTGVYVPGEDPVVDSWAKRIFDGSAKITDIPASSKGLRDAVTVALTSSGNGLLGQPTQTELGLKAKEAAEALLTKLTNREGTSAVGGSRIFGGSLAIPGTDKSNFVIDFQNLKDMLSLDGTRYLKGQGAVSDAERALLASAVTKLNLSQSEDDFKKTLEEIRDTLSGAKYANQNTGGGSQLPASMILNGQTLYLQADGTYE